MNIAANLTKLRQQIILTEQRYNRQPNSVQLLAVSKMQSIAAIKEALEAGQQAFGENYLQEAIPKIQALQALNIEWHFIGRIQSNKTKEIAQYFSWVHSVDSLRHAENLARHRPAELAPLNICLQVNVDDEASKAGIPLKEEVLIELARQVAKLPTIKLRGLMAIPAATTEFNQQRLAFHQLAMAFGSLQQAGLPVDTLSMGMSGDFVAAIAEGATLIRVGTAIFGPRDG